MRIKLILSTIIFTLLSTHVMAAILPAGNAGDIQIKKDSNNLAALQEYTDAAYAAHNKIANGISVDPRDPTYGAVCGGYNIFAGDDTTTVFNYTIPFRGSSSTDKTPFMVYYTPTNGFGTATILTGSQFSVTGVNSGVGGTITLTAPVPTGSTLVIAHDDSGGFSAASSAAVATGGHVIVPDGCTIYGNQILGTQLAEGAQLVGQGFTQNYGFQGQGTKPIMRVIAPAGFEPNFGINVTGKAQQFFEGFEITTNVPGADNLGFLKVPVLIGANNAGAGNGESPGIVAQYMTFNSGKVGFGAPIGGNASYIFAVVRFSNFVANTAGVYGPLSDFQLIGNNFSSNGGFGTYGSAGGVVVGPQQAAVGGAGASRFEFNRFEYNSEGIVIAAGGLINMEGNQFDVNSYCGINFTGGWGAINITGGWFRGNGAGGGSNTGSTTAGRDAHICFNSGATGSGLTIANTTFLTSYSRGYVAPIGSPNATAPLYLIDMNAAGTSNENITFTGGTAQNVTGNNGAYITDFAIFRDGRPASYKVDMSGQSVQGTLLDGAMPAQVRGLPSNQWQNYIAYGDDVTYQQYADLSTLYPYLINQDLRGSLTYKTTPYGFTCDVVDQNIFTSTNPSLTNSPMLTWLAETADPTYGAPASNAVNVPHQTIANSCRLAGLTWLTIPADYKVLGQDAAFVKTGIWTNSALYGGAYGVTSNTNGDTAVGTITSNGGAIYLWYGLKENDGGTFTYSIDGSTPVTLPTNGGNIFSYPVTNHTSVAAVRLPVLTAGSHTVTFTVTSATDVANTVTVFGLGTSPSKAYLGGNPSIFMSGQLYRLDDATYPFATDSYNTQIRSQAEQLKADGLGVEFVDVRKYVNATTDMTGGVNNATPNATGYQHLRDAFEGAIQFQPNPLTPSYDPRNYGAACNTQAFYNTNYGSTNNSVTTTSGSAVISILGYTFVDGVATQTGGGDVGKVISIFGWGTNNPIAKTTYIASVDTGANTATIGVLAANNCTSCQAVMGGYPTDPADPSTAADDTDYIETASAAAVAAGVPVFLPNKCLVHDLTLARHATLQGGMGGTDYGRLEPAAVPPTNLYCASNMLAGDPNTCINVAGPSYNRFVDFRIQCHGFPTFNWGTQTMAAIGAISNTPLAPGAMELDNVSMHQCPVGVGTPFGMNQPVTFTASISGTTMTVSSIDSTNFATVYGFSDPTKKDWLANGRKVIEATYTASQSGTTMTVSAVASGTLAVGQAVQSGGSTSATITALGTGTGGTGTYTLSNSATVTSRTWTTGTTIVDGPLGGVAGTYTIANSHTLASASLTSPANGVFMSGRIYQTAFNNNGINLNGTFSDLEMVESVHTGGFFKCVWLGPNTGGSTGNAANRFALNRYEVCNNGAIMIDGDNGATGAYQFTGEHFQFNSGYAVQTRGTWNDITFTGGTFQGNASNSSTAPIRAQIALGGTGTDFAVTGAEWLKQNFAFGGNSNYLIGTVSGSNVDYVTIDGGDVRNGYNTATVNWAGNTPTNFKIEAAGIPTVDTTQTTLSMPYTGGVAVGTKTSTAVEGQLDIGKAGTTLGKITLNGNTSGTVTVQPAAAAGTWSWTIPTNDGNSGDILTTDGAGVTSWVAPSGPATLHTNTFGLISDMVVGNDQSNHFIFPAAGTITKIWANCKTAPTGQALIFDIDKSTNGGTSWDSIWASTPANRIQIAATANNGTQTSFDTTSFNAGDLVRIDTAQIGSGVAGADCSIVMATTY